MSTLLDDGFKLDVNAPAFERDMFDTLTNMLKYSPSKLPDVFDTLVVSNGRRYRYQKSNTNVPVPTGATEEQLMELKELRKWRLVEEGGGSGSGIITATTAEEMASLAEEGAIVFFTGDDDSTNGFFNGAIYRYLGTKWTCFDDMKKNSSSAEDWNVGDTKVYTGPDTDTLKRGVTYTCTDVVPETIVDTFIQFIPVEFTEDPSTDSTMLQLDSSASPIYYKVSDVETDPVVTAMKAICATPCDASLGLPGEFIADTSYTDAISVKPITELSESYSYKWIETEPGVYTETEILIPTGSVGEAFDVNIGFSMSQAGITNAEDIFFVMLKASDGTLYVYDRDGYFV